MANETKIETPNGSKRKAVGMAYADTYRDERTVEIVTIPDYRFELAQLVRWEAANALRAGDKQTFCSIARAQDTLLGSIE